MRPRLLAVVVMFAVVAGLLVDRWASSTGRPAALADAQRIWWDHAAVASDSEEIPPGVAISFWMVRDFALGDDELARGARAARLVLLGDPEVLVYWNGMLVHAMDYRVGDAADVLDVSTLLRPHNRVAFEVRSDHGAGGVLAALWLDDWSADGEPDAQEGHSGPVWVTDGDWQASREVNSWLLDAWLPLDSPRVAERLVPVRTWPRLDLGRWQPLRIREDVIAPTWPSARQERRFPERIEALPSAEAGPGDTPSWPRGWVVDFGESVDGCLALNGPMAYSRRAHYVDDPATFTQLHGPVEFVAEHRLGPGYRESWILPLPGGGHWLAAGPRSFRAVLLEAPPNAPEPAPEDIWVQACARVDEPSRPDRLFGS